MPELSVYGRRTGLPQGVIGENVRILVDTETGLITSVTTDVPPGREEKALTADLVLPGFVDIHNHGLGGADDALHFWTNPGFSQQRLPALGTTSFLATVLWPRDHQNVIEQLLQQLLPRIQETGHGAVLEGIHVEGPLVHDLGAMPSMATDMPVDTLESWLQSLPANAIRMMTISPHVEAKYNYERLRCLLRQGVRPALGHDRVASEDEIVEALLCAPDQQMHITHLYNVCSFHHRKPGLVNFGLTEKFPNLPQYKGLQPPTIELIGDLEHVHPMALQTALSARHFSNVAFISDSISEPVPGKEISYCGRQLAVSADAHSVVLKGQDILAGSCSSLLQTLRNMVNVLQVPVGRASAMLSETPARIAGLSHVGRLSPSCRGDMLLLSNDLELQQSIVAGQMLYSHNVN